MRVIADPRVTFYILRLVAQLPGELRPTLKIAISSEPDPILGTAAGDCSHCEHLIFTGTGSMIGRERDYFRTGLCGMQRKMRQADREFTDYFLIGWLDRIISSPLGPHKLIHDRNSGFPD